MKVLIRITRQTEYATVVSMKESDFEDYKRRLDGDHKTRSIAERELNNKIESIDWQDDSFHSLDEFEPDPEP